MSDVVLDASALLALVLDEPGATKVAEVLASARMSSVTFGEVINYVMHLGIPPAEANAMLCPLPVDIVETDEGLARIAERLRTVTATAGLSLGDRFCLALAQRDGLPVVTADRQWRTIADSVEAPIIVVR